VKKILYVILDGAAGRPCKTLGGKTSLEAAKTPFIDSLFQQSVNGLMHVVGPNIAPQSDVAAFATMGYSPFNVPSRGIIEAIGSGYDYKEGEVAMRCNLGVVKKGKLVKIRLAHLSKDEGLEVERLINEGVSLDVPFTFKHTIGYRGFLVLHDQLSDKVTNTHPGYIRERLGTELVSFAQNIKQGVELKKCKALAPEAVKTAEVINDFTNQSNEVLTNAGLKTNYVLIRDPGNSLPFLKPFKDLHGVSMALLAEMPVELGVAKLLGLTVIKPSDDFGELAKKVVKASKDHGAVYVHIKGPDKYGHLGDANGKVREIERIDKEFIKPLLELINLKDYTICVTSDHATPACFGSHSSDPVPYLITNGEKSKGHFYEGSVKKDYIEGKELFSKIISVAKS